MQMKDLATRVRSYTRDTTGTLFSSSDVKDFINEGIDKFRQIKQLSGMVHLNADIDEPILLPSQYHYALAVYSASRCFSQDEQQYPAQTYMEEFNNLFFKVELGIKDGSIIITDSNGNVVIDEDKMDAVDNVYFETLGGGVDV